jgi:hypothetical protein
MIYRAAGKTVAFAEGTQGSGILALSCKRLSLQLNTFRQRGDASNLVQKSNKRVIHDEEVQIKSKQGNVMF